MAAETLLGAQMLLDYHLGGDSGMIGTRNPADIVAVASPVACYNVLVRKEVRYVMVSYIYCIAETLIPT